MAPPLTSIVMQSDGGILSSRSIRPWTTEYMAGMINDLVVTSLRQWIQVIILKHIEQANTVIHEIYIYYIISYINEGRLVSAKTMVSSPPFLPPIAYFP